MHRRRFLQTTAALSCGAALWGDEANQSDVAWLTAVQKPPATTPPEVPKLQPLLVDAQGMPITTRDDWERRRDQLRRAWLEFLGPLSREHLAGGASTDDAPVRQPPVMTVLEEDRVEGVVRQLIRYEVESGQTVEAYLLRPESLPGPQSRGDRMRFPGVAVFHSTVPESLRQPAGVEGAPEKAFGLQLARRGCVAICPRNYLWPENHRIDAKGAAASFLERHPQSVGMDRMLLDALIAVDILAADPQVDPQRIGCIGHSLGAKEVLYLAAFDDRVRVTVSSEGGIGTTYSNWHDAWYLGPAITGPEFKREHHELLAMIAPRPFLLVGGDSADGDRSWPFIAAALPVYHLYGEPARIGLLNHQQGHSVPAEANAQMLDWLVTYLSAGHL
ncbi:MAG: dienelactone hydrolase family protein [Planctomycetaceae bacterium]|nr:dienelactone hydrolase family protein [Planctomycetaceae bacterium]